jgi:hypothetical protein
VYLHSSYKTTFEKGFRPISSFPLTSTLSLIMSHQPMKDPSDFQNAGERTRPPSITGVSPPRHCSLLAQACEHSHFQRSEWQWSGYSIAHGLRRWKWDQYRCASSREPPISLACGDSEDFKVEYIQPSEVMGFLQDKRQPSSPFLKVILSFTNETCVPYTTSLSSAIISTLSDAFGVQWLLEYYPYHLANSFCGHIEPKGTAYGT